MKTDKRKFVAPIVVTVLIVLYYFLYFAFLISLLDGFIKIFLGVVPIVFSALTIAVCIERIKEIKKGEENDISKYWLYFG